MMCMPDKLHATPAWHYIGTTGGNIQRIPSRSESNGNDSVLGARRSFVLEEILFKTIDIYLHLHLELVSTRIP